MYKRSFWLFVIGLPFYVPMLLVANGVIFQSQLRSILPASLLLTVLFFVVAARKNLVYPLYLLCPLVVSPIVGWVWFVTAHVISEENEKRFLLLSIILTLLFVVFAVKYIARVLPREALVKEANLPGQNPIRWLVIVPLLYVGEIYELGRGVIYFHPLVTVVFLCLEGYVYLWYRSWRRSRQRKAIEEPMSST